MEILDIPSDYFFTPIDLETLGRLDLYPGCVAELRLPNSEDKMKIEIFDVELDPDSETGPGVSWGVRDPEEHEVLCMIMMGQVMPQLALPTAKRFPGASPVSEVN